MRQRQGLAEAERRWEPQDQANGTQPSGLGLVLVDRKIDDRKMGTALGSEEAIFLSSIFLSSFRPLDS
jgi:hypothetical protein